MFANVFGVDFSGAKLAGRNTWIARLERLSEGTTSPSHRLVELASLERLGGVADREPALAHLVDLIAGSSDSLWALDFPFGLPIEVHGTGKSRSGTFEWVESWEGDAYALGLECLDRARGLGGPNHIRRLTDQEMKTPFDCYHYRIIYQTFHGIKQVLGPLRKLKQTAILPFQYRRLPTAKRVLVEACPASTLKRLGLCHQNYKQAQGGPLTVLRRRNRRSIIDGLRHSVLIDERERRVMMRNPGADALDALIAAVGGVQAWAACDHASVSPHPRYPREGRIYA